MRGARVIVVILSGCAPGQVSDGSVLRIEPAAPRLVVDPTQGEATLQLRAWVHHPDQSDEIEVTQDVGWSVPAADALGRVGGDGVLVATGIGGHATITAALGGLEASAPLTVTLRATLFAAGTDDTVRTRFDTAMIDASARVDIEYPEHGVVMPSNAGPIDVQWSQAGAADVHRVHFTASDVLDLTVYTTQRELVWSADLWAKVAATAADHAFVITVESNTSTGTTFVSGERALEITGEQLSLDPIITHGFEGRPRALDPSTQTEWFLTTEADGQCAGCHRFSRDGKRVAFLRRAPGAPSISINEHGTLAYDPSTTRYRQTVAPAAGSYAGTAAFNSQEAATRPALLLTVPDATRDTTLALVDPTTGAVVPSNLATALASGAAAGKAIVLPEWSPTGDFVVFAAYDPVYELVFGGAPYAALLQATVSYDAATRTFTFGVPEVLVAAGTTETVYGAAISNDGTTVAFVRARSEGAALLDRYVMLVRRADRSQFELSGSRAPAGQDWKSLSPAWAPREGAKYAWIVYASVRPYGHLHQPVGQFPNHYLWIVAVDREELAAGGKNPIRTGFFVGGQQLGQTYIFPQWTVAQ